MNNILAQLNSAPMYAICGGIIAFVAAVCVVFLVRSYRAGLAIGCLLYTSDAADD